MLKTKPKGIALVLVIFVIALATIVVVNLTYSTYLAARANLAVEKSLFAEYLLKSSVNIAKSYLQADENPNADGPLDSWAKLFSRGEVVPYELLGIPSQEALNLSLEVIAENRKLPIRDLVDPSTGQANVKKRDILVRLFRLLGFDDDITEIDTSESFKGKHFTSEELVANLIDYMDPDSVSYMDSNFAAGIESNAPKGIFANKKPDWISELNSIPGFTARRVRQLEPLLTFFGQNNNINFAPPAILQSLSNLIGSAEIQQIIEFRESEQGPFSDASQISNIIGNQAYQDATGSLGYNSDYFQVIGKVDLGIKAYYVRAILLREVQNNSIQIKSLEFF